MGTKAESARTLYIGSINVRGESRESQKVKKHAMERKAIGMTLRDRTEWIREQTEG